MRLYVIFLLLGLAWGGKVVHLSHLLFDIYSNHYSGYLNVSKTHRLHYWFFESQNTPSTDPLVFWFNGGPGCSSLYGLLEENGPFVFHEDHETFRRNEYSWNRIANVVYLESPAGAGYSYSTDGNMASNDDLTADENYVAIKEFLKEFPQFRNHDMFLTGESYAGVFISMLADKIIDGQKDYAINLKGIAIGNGFLNLKMRKTSMLLWSYYNGFIEATRYHNFVKKCCDGNLKNCNFDATNSICESMYNFFFNNYPEVDRYDVSRKCAIESMSGKSPFKSCGYDRSKIENYFNNEKVRKELYIPTNVHEWSMCGRKNYTTMREDMSEHIKKAVKNGVRTLLFYGDQDSMCPFLLGQQFAADLKLPKLLGKSPWLFENTVAGYKTTYEGLIFLTIRGAGHMVPKTHPRQSFAFIQQFLNNQPI